MVAGANTYGAVANAIATNASLAKNYPVGVAATIKSVP